ncbi:efflux RND transporter periplasmic adaptor subunit [bacterium]|nr:efflux RND transporter periplasmic adaptor subunit [bacterium]
MSHHRTLLVTLTCALLIAGCSGDKEPAKKGGMGGKRGPGGAVTVSLEKVGPRDLMETLALTGTLAADRQVAIAPRVSGRLTEVLVQMGDPVKKGQVLAKLDDAELQASVQQARAAVESARATKRQREIDHANLARIAKRTRELLDKDFISRQEYEDAQAKADGAQATVALAASEVSRQEAALREKREALSQAVITAPMSGVVGARLLEPGAIAGPSQTVLSLVTAGSLKTIVQVGEAALPRLKVGSPATAQVDAWPDRTFKAKVSRVAPMVSTDTHTAQVELALDDPTGALRPGMFARIGLTLQERKGAPTVPIQALVKQKDQDGVFVAEGDKVRFVPVRTGILTETHAEVVEGPALGTAIVTMGNHLLRDGASIRAEGERKRRGPGDGAPGEWQGKREGKGKRNESH